MSRTGNDTETAASSGRNGVEDSPEVPSPTQVPEGQVRCGRGASSSRCAAMDVGADGAQCDGRVSTVVGYTCTSRGRGRGGWKSRSQSHEGGQGTNYARAPYSESARFRRSGLRRRNLGIWGFRVHARWSNDELFHPIPCRPRPMDISVTLGIAPFQSAATSSSYSERQKRVPSLDGKEKERTDCFNHHAG